MKLKTFSIVCVTLACLILTSITFAKEQQSFIRKIRKGGFLDQSIQMRDGSYVFLHSNRITKVKALSDKRISEVSLTFDAYAYAYTELNEIAQTLDGFVLVGWFQEDYYDDAKGILVKVNMEGQVVWKKLIGGNGNESIGFDSVIPTADGGFIVTGWMRSLDLHPVLIKFSSGGDVLWSKSFDNFSTDRFFLSTPALNGRVILVANLIQSDGKSRGANVIKINGSGNLVWAVTLEMKEFLLEEITTLSDQGYLLAGKTNDLNKLLLVRLNADGTIHSNAAYSLDVPNFSVSYLAQTPDGGIAISGDIRKNTGSALDGFLLKINDRQELTLQKRLGFPKNQETTTTVFAKEDGSYLLFGSTYDGVSFSDTLFMGLNSNGLAGCNFSHHLSASKVLYGSVKPKKLAITPNTFAVFTDESLKVTSERLNRQISNACAK